MGNWLSFQRGTIMGPYSDAQIHAMLKKGTLTPESKVCRQEEQIWKSIASFPELQSPEAEKKKTAKTPKAVKENAPTVVDLPVAANQRKRGSEIIFDCPHCGQKYSCGSEFFQGEAMSCQVCSKTFLLTENCMEEDIVPDENDNINSMENADFSEDIPEGDITCPHCWKTFSKENVCYISCHPDLLGDPIAGEFEQKRFIPTAYHSSGLPLDAKGMPCSDIACPHCHLRLPASVIDLDSLYFSIAGAPSSGKSYFLTAMIHEMRKKLPTANYSFYDVDPVINSVLDSYENTIFMSVDPDKVAALPKTQQIGGDFSSQIQKNGMTLELPRPFIFRLQSSDGKDIDRNIIFYDNAGEHFQPGADTVSNPATIHLSNSNGIIFLFDPLNDANMRRTCDQRDPQTQINAKVSDQTVLFAEMVNRIRRHGNFTSEAKCDIPLVIAVGKYDTWADGLAKKVPEIPQFLMDGDNLSPELNWNAVMDVSFAVREIMAVRAPALVSQAETFFNEVYFVPVSSFGCLASKGENGAIGIIPSNMNPVWVDVPINLLLCRKGLLKKSMKKYSANAVESLACKTVDKHIVFKHPVTGARVSLPSNYSDVMLEIRNKYYSLPRTESERNNIKSKNNESVWE